MLSNHNILLLIGILLFSGSSVAIADDDNPWIMDESSNRQQPYFDLSAGGAGGSSAEGQKSGQSSQLQLLGRSGRARESIVPKSAPFNRGQVGSDKEDRDQYFGYAGPQPKIRQRDLEPTDRNRFGTFPPVSGMVDERRNSSMSARSGSSVQYGGKSYGAFPPKEGRPIDRERQDWRAFQAQRARQRQRQARAFGNVAPPPVPEPAPMYAYPSLGNGMRPGYGTGYGTGIAPSYGNGANGLGGLGAGYGPSLVDPGMLGMTMPGFMW
jgi:hypothetical protein